MQVLFARHHARVYGFILRLLGSEPAAEDLTSEVFLGVWRQADRFEARSSGYHLAAGDRPLQGARGAASPAGARRRRKRAIRPTIRRRASRSSTAEKSCATA